MLALLLAPAGAVQLDVSPAELCARAPIVAVVEPTSDEVRWSTGPRGGLETHTWLHVHAVLKGSLRTQTAEVLIHGGTLDSGLRHWVEDEPDLALDHRYLVFLKPRDGVYRVFGGELGVFPLRHDADPTTAMRQVCR